MANFFVTFGQRYAHEEHPSFPDAHPDGYIQIEAPDYWSARETIHKFIGTAWAFIYSEDDFASSKFLYTRGALATIEYVPTEDEIELHEKLHKLAQEGEIKAFGFVDGQFDGVILPDDTKLTAQEAIDKFTDRIKVRGAFGQ